MTGKLALTLSLAALLILCGCSSYEVTSSGDTVPLPPANGLSLDVEVSFGRDNTELVTTIKIDIAAPGWARLEVLNVTGHRVKLLLDRELTWGFETVTWNGRNDDGEEIKSGLYIYRLEASGVVYTKAALLCQTEEDCEKLRGEN